MDEVVRVAKSAYLTFPTLPEAEVKAIARGAATTMALKLAALKRLQSGA